MRCQHALIDERLQTPAAVPNRPFPVFRRASSADILKLAGRIPGVFVLDATASTAAAQSHFVQLRGGRLTANGENVLRHWHFSPIAHRARRRVMIGGGVVVVAVVLVIM